jgi:hypothetical protein
MRAAAGWAPARVPSWKSKDVFSRIGSLLFVAALFVGASSVALAQDASPEAERPPRDISLLKALGLPEINLVANDTDVTGLPQSVEAGRYLVTLDDQTADQEVEVYFGVLPASVTLDQALADLNSDSEETPAWAYDATWAGGPNPYAGQTDGAVVDLTEGTWFVAFDRQTESDSQPEDTAQPLQVTAGSAATPAAIADAVPVNMKEYTFEIPATVASGPQIWEMGNTGTQPHFMVLFGVPDGTTMEQVLATVNTFMSGTPAADALAFEDIHDVYDSSFISSGQHEWIQVNLDPGTYAAVCFFGDKDTGQPHALLGMITVFTAS